MPALYLKSKEYLFPAFPVHFSTTLLTVTISLNSSLSSFMKASTSSKSASYTTTPFIIMSRISYVKPRFSFSFSSTFIIYLELYQESNSIWHSFNSFDSKIFVACEMASSKISVPLSFLKVSRFL